MEPDNKVASEPVIGGFHTQSVGKEKTSGLELQMLGPIRRKGG